MKKNLLLIFAIISTSSIIAQVSFTNRNDLIGNYEGSTSITVDMNGDYLDDLSPDSLKIVEHAMLEPYAKEAKVGD